MHRRIVNITSRFFHARRHSYLEKMIDFQGMSSDQIRDIQKTNLRDLIKHAYETVPFYQAKFDNVGLGSDIVNGIVNIESLPILKRDDLRDCRDALVSSTADKSSLIFGKTGGSTGNPVSFYYDRAAYDKMLAAQWRLFMWAGWRSGERVLTFWGALQDLTAKGKLRKVIGEQLTGEVTIPVYEFDDDKMAGWLNRINSLKPSILYGYPSVLAALARYIVNSGKRPVKIRGVFSTAEVLYDEQRRVIEAAFKCKVFNQYGCREIPAVAGECSHGNMHMFSDMAYVENLPDEETQNKRLIITSLSNWSMPLVRYELGDMGQLREEGCDCGLPFPVMEMGMCKSNDVFAMPNGRRVHPSYFNSLLKDVSGLSEYQFRQVSLVEIILYITKKDSSNILVRELESLQGRIQQDLYHDMTFRVEVVDAMPRAKSGKFRYIVSDITNSSADRYGERSDGN